MKIKLLYSFTFLILFSASLKSSGQCQNINGDFDTYTGTPGSTAWINDSLENWYVSHGKGHFINSPGTEMLLVARFTIIDTFPAGEGVYTEFAFIKGHTYTVSYDLLLDEDDSSAFAGFHARLSNGLSPALPYPFGSDRYPSTVGTQSITDMRWTTNGTWTTITETFVASNSYKNLWFYPIIEEFDTISWKWYANAHIDNVCIEELEVDPCNVVPDFVYHTGGEWCQMSFENTSFYPSGDRFQVFNTTWDFGDGRKGTGNFVSHAYANAGTYTVEMTVWTTNGTECCKTSTSYTVEVSEVCAACDVMLGAEIEVIGTNPFTFNATIFPGIHNDLYGYYWDFGDGSSQSGKSVDHSYSSSGNYLVTLTIFYYDEILGECCSHAVSVYLYANEIPSGGGGDDPGGWYPIKDESDQTMVPSNHVTNTLNIFPNPSNGFFTLLPSGGLEVSSVHVYDINGKLIHQSLNNSDTKLYQLDLSHLENGTYFIKINEGDHENMLSKPVLIKE